MEDQTISKLCTDDDNQNPLSNPNVIIKSGKNVIKHFTPTRQLPKLLLLNFLATFLTEKKYIINNLNFVRQNYL